jgi:RNA polymerase sigma-70 factor (ECF subfamily)
VVSGRDKVVRLLFGIAAKVPPNTTYEFEVFNGELGIVARQHGQTVSALAFALTADGISALYLVSNPRKLGALDLSSRAERHRVA